MSSSLTPAQIVQVLPKNKMLTVQKNGVTGFMNREEFLTKAGKFPTSLRSEGKQFTVRVNTTEGELIVQADPKRAARLFMLLVRGDRKDASQTVKAPCRMSGKQVGIQKSDIRHGTAECPWCGRDLVVVPIPGPFGVEFEEDEEPFKGSAILPEHRE